MEAKTPDECIAYWEDQIEKVGYEIVKSNIREKNGYDYGQNPFIRIALEKYDRKQEDERQSKRDEREEETLEIARKANEISERANTFSQLAIVVSMLAIIISVVVAFGQKES